VLVTSVVAPINTQDLHRTVFKHFSSQASSCYQLATSSSAECISSRGGFKLFQTMQLKRRVNQNPSIHLCKRNKKGFALKKKGNTAADE